MVPYAKENIVSGNFEFNEDVLLKQDSEHSSKKEYSLNRISQKEFEIPSNKLRCLL